MMDRIDITVGRHTYTLRQVRPEFLRKWPVFFLLEVDGRTWGSADTLESALDGLRAILPAAAREAIR
jgi:hypothetical protein